jgi:hypothetical protein
MIRLEKWDEFKSVVDTHSISIQYTEFSDRYYLTAIKGGISFFHILVKGGENQTNQDDFDNNYKSSGNSLPEIGQINVQVQSDDAPGCPVISDKLKIEYSGSNITMSSGYNDIYSYTGSGKLYGFALDFNSDSVRVKLTVDGNQVFALTLDEVEGMQAFSSSGCDDNSGTAEGICNMIKKASGNRLYFCPPCPIEYNTSVLIEGQRSGSSNKYLDKKMVFLTKES